MEKFTKYTDNGAKTTAADVHQVQKDSQQQIYDLSV